MSRLSFLFLLFFCSCFGSDIDKSLNEAQGYIGVGKYQQAIDIYDDVIDDHPDDQKISAVLFLKGQLLENNFNDQEKAASSYDELIRKFPNSQIVKRARTALAGIYAREKRWDDVVAQFEGLVYLEPENSEYRLRLAEAYISAGNLFQAKVELGPLLNNMSKIDKEMAARALFDYGEIFLLDTKYDDAIFQYKSLIEKYPKSGLVGESMVKIATCYELMGYLDMAAGYLFRAKTYFPNSTFIQKRIDHLKKRGKKGKEPK